MAKEVEVGRIYVKVVPDLRGFAADLLKDLKTIEKRLPSIKIDVELDKTSAARLKKELEALAKDLDAEIAPSVEKAAAALTRAQLAALTRPRTVPIIPRVSRATAREAGKALAAITGARLVDSTLRNFKDLFGSIDKAIPLIGGLALAIQGLFGILIVSVANMFSLARSLAQIAGAGLALPGLLTGMAIGLGLTAIAFSDINKVMPEVIDKYAGLKQVISDNFWAEALDPMREMANNLFPAIEEGVSTVSTELGKFFGALSTGLENALGDRIPGMFKDLADSITIFTGAADSIARIIGVLGSVGASYLPQLATWFKEVLNNFASFLERSEASGAIFDWIDTGITNLQALGTFLLRTVQIFGDLGKAAEGAGSATINSLADGLTRIREVTSSPAFQEGLTKVFGAAHDMMSRIAREIGPELTTMFQNMGSMAEQIFPKVGDAIGNVLDTILRVANDPKFGAGLFLFFDGIKTATEHLKGVAPQIASALGIIHGIMGVIARGAGPLLATVFSQINSVLEKIAPTLGVFIYNAMMQFNEMLTEARPYIDAIADAFAVLLEKLGEAHATVFPALRDVFMKILEGLPPMIAKFGELIDALTRLWEFISPVLVPALEFLVEIIQNTVIGLIDGIKNIINGFITTVTSLWSAFTALFRGDWDTFWSSLKDALAGILQLIWGVIEVWWNGTIIGAFRRFLFGALRGIWKSGWNFLKDFIKSPLAAIWGLIKGAMSKVTGSISTGISTIRTTWSAGWSAVKVAAETIWNAIRIFFKTILESIKALLKGDVNTFKLIWRTGMTLIRSAIRSGLDKILAIFRGLGGTIKSAVGDLGGILWNAGKSVINGFLDGINSMIGSVRSKFGELTSMIPKIKGPPKKDKKLLFNAGELIMQGLIRGIDSEMKGLERKLHDVTDLIEGTSIGAPEMSGFNSSIARAAYDDSASVQRGGSILNYYAADGRSAPKEDVLEALRKNDKWKRR